VFRLLKKGSRDAKDLQRLASCLIQKKSAYEEQQSVLEMVILWSKDMVVPQGVVGNAFVARVVTEVVCFLEAEAVLKVEMESAAEIGAEEVPSECQ